MRTRNSFALEEMRELAFSGYTRVVLRIVSYLALALAICLAAFSQTGSQAQSHDDGRAQRQPATEPNDNIAASRDALEEQKRQRVRLDRANARHHLTNWYRSEGERASGTQQLEQAIALFREALKERTRELVPLDWAATQNDLGCALMGLAGRESRVS